MTASLLFHQRYRVAVLTPACPIPAPILTQSPVSSADGKPPGERLALKRRFEVGRGGGAWGFVICASARPVYSDSVNTTIAVSFLVDKPLRSDYKRKHAFRY